MSRNGAGHEHDERHHNRYSFALLAAVGSIAEMFIKWCQRIQSRRGLMWLSEHDLSDIGLTRLDAFNERCSRSGRVECRSRPGAVHPWRHFRGRKG